MPHASIRSSASSAPIAGRGNSRASSVLGFVRTTARTVSLRAIGVDLHQRAEAAVKRRRAAGHETRLEHLEDLLARGAEPDRALHVGDEAVAVGAAKGEERDGDELADLGRDVPALAQPQLVDPVVGLDELRVLPGGELPLRVDVAARRLHLRDQRLRALRRALLDHRHLRSSLGSSRLAASSTCASWSPPAKRSAMWRAPASIQRWIHSTQPSIGPAQPALRAVMTLAGAA